MPEQVVGAEEVPPPFAIADPSETPLRPAQHDGARPVMLVVGIYVGDEADHTLPCLLRNAMRKNRTQLLLKRRSG